MIKKKMDVVTQILPLAVDTYFIYAVFRYLLVTVEHEGCTSTLLRTKHRLDTR